MRGLLRRARRFFRDEARPVILMYHRVARPAHDPWGLSVSPERFAAQMAWLAARRDVLPMADFVERLQQGTLPRRAAAVTFDDGYVDNLRVAKPILAQLGVPATVFIATGFIGSRYEYWWDDLARRLLGAKGPVETGVVIGAERIAVGLPAASEDAPLDPAWRAWMPTASWRGTAYAHLWNAIRELDPEGQQAAIEAVRAALPAELPAPADLPMRREEVAELVAGNVISVGAHTVTHPHLTRLPLEGRKEEIARSRADTAAMAGASVEGFAYPHGDFDAATAALVRESGLRWACSTRSAAVDPAAYDLFDLPRLQVMDWDASNLADAIASLE